MQEGSLIKVLKEGNMIKTRFNSKQDWVLNTLHKIYESIIDIDIRQDDIYLDEFLAIGDSIECQYLNDNSEYLLEGWVSRIKSDPPQRITVQIHKISKIEELAVTKDYSTFLGCVVKPKPKDKGVFTIAKKVSKDAITFISKTPIESKDNLYLELLISGNIAFRTTAKIDRIEESESGNVYTVSFVDTDTLNNRIIENFLNELEKGEIDNYNKENSFWKKNSKIVR